MSGSTVAVVLAAILPGVCIATLLAWRGRPLRTLLPALVLGGLACAPALLLERLLTVQPWDMANLGALVAFAFIVVGLVEEGCKLGAWYLGPARWNRDHTDAYDSVLYAACIGLGFATVENVAYCLHGGFETALTRAFTAVPAHTMFGVLMGVWLGRARLRRAVGWSTEHLVLSGFVLAVVAHGVYDVLAFQSSTPALALLLLGLLGGAVWSVSAVREARRQSPACGGTAPLLPAPLRPVVTIAPSAPLRDPTKALAWGFVPGLGQAYNGEPRKAALFAGLAIVNALLYLFACWFADDPGAAVRWLASIGIAPNLTMGDLPAAVENRALLPLVLRVAMLGGLGFGAFDAWNDAQAARTRRRRESFAPHGAVLSYLTHLALLLALAFAPLLARKVAEATRSASGGQSPPGARAASNAGAQAVDLPMQLTRVEKLDGWTPPGRTAPPAPKRASKSSQPVQGAPRPEVASAPVAPSRPGNKGASTPRTAPPIVRTPSSHSPRRAPAASREPSVVDVPAPTVGSGPSVRGAGEDGVDDRPRPGTGGTGTGAASADGGGDRPFGQEGWYSYNQYLSYRFHEGHEADLFFRNVPMDVWVVVRYEIDGDGSLLGVAVVETSGERWQAELVPTLIRRCAPYRALPDGVRRVTITELFWAREYSDFPAGSLAESLSRLPDGRLIRE